MDRVRQIRDRLAKIAMQDTLTIITLNRAMNKMAELGLTSEQIYGYLKAEPALTEEERKQPFHGFETRRQATLAAMAGSPKGLWPAGLQAAHDRVNTLLKNQEPEANGGGEQSLIMIPVVVSEGAHIGPVRTFRRLKSGRIREINSQGTFNVHEEVPDDSELLDSKPVIDIEVAK